MENASTVRKQVESAMHDRMLGALSPRMRTQPERNPCGNVILDKLLKGGLASASITELVGSESSGRTTIALSYLAAMTSEGKFCAWIDVSDTLDIESAAANGIDLERLLWVRCGSGNNMGLSSKTDLREPISTSAKLAEHHMGASIFNSRFEGGNIHDMSVVQEDMYEGQQRHKKRQVGTPGAPNRRLTNEPSKRDEQVNSDRQLPRRGINLALTRSYAELRMRHFGGMSKRKSPVNSASSFADSYKKKESLWKALDQALRVTDLLLQNGGFCMIVLDMGSIAPESAWRVPLATWFRFRAACEQSRVGLVLLTQHSCARSSAEHVLRLQNGSIEVDGRLMTGVRYRAATERSRSNTDEVASIRKPVKSDRPAEWVSNGTWSLAR
jgi:recombination protein RecA